MPAAAKPCALCLLNKPLLASHFLPAAIYKNLIDPTGPIKNMIASNLSKASEESKQVKQYLLCQDCEILFQQGGENWVLGRRLMPNGSFELRDLLRQATPVRTQQGASFFTLNTVPTVDNEQLLYFAASIFWRAAVTDWETPVGHYTKLAIEPAVVEELRKYLLGSGRFPADISILVIFSAADNPETTNYSAKHHNWSYGIPTIRLVYAGDRFHALGRTGASWHAGSFHFTKPALCGD
jgi:hypothetical protein